MKDEALKLALEALKTCQIDGDGWSGPHYWFDSEKVGKAIAAIKQALANDALDKMVENEREACAKIADTWKDNVVWEARTVADNIGREIRNRKHT